MGIKGLGFQKGFLKQRIGNNLPSDIPHSNGEEYNCFLDGSSIFYLNFLNWNGFNCKEIDQAIISYCRDLENFFHDIPIAHKLIFDDYSKRPPKKEKRATNKDVHEKIAIYVSRLKHVIDMNYDLSEVFGPISIELIVPEDDDDNSRGPVKEESAEVGEEGLGEVAEPVDGDADDGDKDVDLSLDKKSPPGAGDDSSGESTAGVRSHGQHLEHGGGGKIMGCLCFFSDFPGKASHWGRGNGACSPRWTDQRVISPGW